MKLNVKTLKGSQFEIRVQPSDTVMAVKKSIEDSQGKDNYPCGQQLLIHNGKVLKDESTLAENKVIEDGFVVVMLSKTRSISSSDASSTQVLVDMFEQLGSRPRQTFHPPANDASAQELDNSETYIQAASSLVAGSNLEQTIQQIMDIGGGSWDKETVARALRAAYNNPERAVDYLYSGIPEAAEIAIPVPSFPANAARLEGGGAGAAAATSVSGRPNSSPLNLFPQEMITGSGVGEPGALDFLRNSQQFQTLRLMVQENPHILQPMLQELGKQNPELLGLIQEHQTEFLQLINDPLEDSEGDISDQVDEEMPHAINVTPEEQEAIRRLEGMGFDRVQVLEAFFACDRNEELAANYLLEHAGDSED